MQKIKENNTRVYDLAQRTLKFAKNIRVFIKELPKTQSNFEDIKQLVRSSGSVGANYIEAEEALSKKDFVLRIKIARKESKETRYWLNVVDINSQSSIQRRTLIQEALELTKIFGAIIEKSK